MYSYAVQLINKGKAYVCDLSSEQIRKSRGTLNNPGEKSPFRDRTIDENLCVYKYEKWRIRKW